MFIVADIEADGLLHATPTKPAATLIHCLCAHIIETGETYTFADHPGYLPMRDGLELLDAATYIIGHNFLRYDKPMIRKFKRHDLDANKVLDTLHLCKLLLDLNDLGMEDKVLVEQGRMPLGMTRRLSLESWGYRLGRHKVAHNDWATFSPAMVERCIGDVLLNRDLYAKLEPMADRYR
jgi:DNA polymerase-1